MKRTFFLLLFLVTMSVYSNAQNVRGSFFQEIKTEIPLPSEAGNNVIKLFSSQNKPVAVTSSGVFKFNNGIWSGKITDSEIKTAFQESTGKIWFVTDKWIENEDGFQISIPEEIQKNTITCLLPEDEKTLLVGTDSGLYSYNAKWNEIPEIKGKRVNSMVKNINNELWLATTDGLLQRTKKEWINLDDALMATGTRRVYYSLYQNNEKKEIYFGGLYSVGIIAENGNHRMWSGADGLPYGPITSIAVHNSVLWLGTPKGAVKKDDNWHYYLGKRWLPNNKINDILPIDEHTVWIATPEGISQIKQVKMTLTEKAAFYEDVIQKRHNRRGLVNISHLKFPGDLATSTTKNEDNDGLWTATYLAAECFRFAVTHENDARENAINTYLALERLETVTGISGLPARSYALATDSVDQSRSPHPKKWRPSPDGKWQWLDDTSSDEIVGHMFALSVFYDLVGDDAMKIRVRNLVSRIMNHIIDNDFHLIDYDGLPTRWGVWHPDSINLSKNWAYEKGLYSLEILSFLKTAYHITGDPKFRETYIILAEKHQYAKNTVQAKMFGPFENSHSDDILTYFSYYPLFQYGKKDEYFSLYLRSLERTWKVSQPEKIPAWNIIASACLNKDCDLDVALEELKNYPVDLIDWTMENRYRWDLPADPIVARGGNQQAIKHIPAPESGISRWNTNPRQFDTGREGMREETGTYFLLPYWMGRYHGFFKE